MIPSQMQLYVALGTIAPDCITFAKDSGFTQNVQHIHKNEIAGVTSFFQDNSSAKREPMKVNYYNLDTITKIVLVMSRDRESYSFECQAVANQATWSGGTEADLLVAVNEIATFI